MKNIQKNDLQEMVQRIFELAGSSTEEASAIAEYLVEANLVGHDSHGVIRVAHYVNWIREKRVFVNQHVEEVIKGDTFAVFDGHFGFGQVLGREAVQVGIDMAKDSGVSVVGLRNSGHLGRIGDWAIMAAEAGLVSIHFVNGNGFSMLAVPFGGSDKRLSSNPICVGIPRGETSPIILDIATCQASHGKIMVAKNKGERLPLGMIVDDNGQPSCDPNVMFGQKMGAILPMSPGHKGFGLALICELLAGALTGSDTSHPNSPTVHHVGNGMLSIYIDRKQFREETGYLSEIDKLVDWVKGSPLSTPDGEILLPGEPEERTKNDRLEKGIPLDDDTISQIADTAKSVGVPVEDINSLFKI